MMKPEQRPNAGETREPKNASPRRVPLNAMLGLKSSDTEIMPTRQRKKPLFYPELDATYTELAKLKKVKDYPTLFRKSLNMGWDVVYS